MRTLTSMLLATLVCVGVANAQARECQTRALAFDLHQGGELDRDDCTVPGSTCSDCSSRVPGEYWTFDAAAGDLILVTVQGTTGQYRPGGVGPGLETFDSSGRRVGSDWPHSCEWAADVQTLCPGRWFRAETSGTYHVLVADGGYMFVHYGGYAIRVQRINALRPGSLWTDGSGNSVSVTWWEHLSPAPVLEYALEAGSASRASNVAFVSLGRPAQRSPGCGCYSVNFASVPSGTYFVRVRARTAIGWGPASLERSFTSTDGPQHLRARVVGRTVALDWSSPPSDSPFTFELNNGLSSSFEILVGMQPGVTSVVYTVPRSQPLNLNPYWYSASGVPPGTYYVRVRGRTSAGVTAPSNEVVVNVF